MSDDLDALTTASRQDLIAHWEAAYRRPAPKGISRRLLEYAAAYNIQVGRHSGLKPATKRKLRQKAQAARERRLNGGEAAAPKKRSHLTVGTRLMRDWHSSTHTVDVVEDGFRYNKQTYKSLSEIAKTITGAHWSGPRFFGVK
ncbi:MAG: DUF2924 domain-containing protein [Alphaproteobacteria bacterium]